MTSLDDVIQRAYSDANCFDEGLSPEGVRSITDAVSEWIFETAARVNAPLDRDYGPEYFGGFDDGTEALTTALLGVNAALAREVYLENVFAPWIYLALRNGAGDIIAVAIAPTGADHWAADPATGAMQNLDPIVFHVCRDGVYHTAVDCVKCSWRFEPSPLFDPMTIWPQIHLMGDVEPVFAPRSLSIGYE